MIHPCVDGPRGIGDPDRSPEAADRKRVVMSEQEMMVERRQMIGPFK